MDEVLPIVLGLVIGGLRGGVGRAPRERASRVRAPHAWAWVPAVLAGVAVSVLGGELAVSAWSPVLDGATALAGWGAGVFLRRGLPRRVAPDVVGADHAPR